MGAFSNGAKEDLLHHSLKCWVAAQAAVFEWEQAVLYIKKIDVYWNTFVLLFLKSFSSLE